MWLKIFYILIGLIILILINEFIHGLIRQNHRKNIYQQAVIRSKKINKPLIVIGDPYYGKGSRFYNMFMKGYECGDVTVDLTGCPLCPNGIKNDILSYLKSIKEDNTNVIFISCVLEYVDDIENVIKEINRVAGSSDNIFIVSVNKYTLAAYFYSEDKYYAKSLIKGPPEYNTITYTKL